MTNAPHGFWVRGGKHGERVLVHAVRSFAGFAACDACLDLSREHFLSVFTFGAGLRVYMAAHASTKGFDGPCCADHLWFDIDRADNIEAALADTRALAIASTDQWGVPDDALLVFFSGSKGFHVGVPAALWSPAPSAQFNHVARRLAETISRSAGGGIVIDTSIYSKVGLFRAPNSWHAKTGFHKVILAHEELLSLSIEAIKGLARSPRPFDVPEGFSPSERLVEGWAEACREVEAERAAMTARTAALTHGGGPDRLNTLTLEFIREGAPVGGDGACDTAGRHRRLFAAAANLGEFGCPPRLVHALLTDAALDCGITPSEVRRTIDNALRKSQNGAAPDA